MVETFYVGFRLGKLEIGLEPHGQGQGMTGLVGHCFVDENCTCYQRSLEGDAVAQWTVSSVGEGEVIESLPDADADADGIATGLIQPAS